MDIQGKIGIITGAAAGIGQAVAYALAEAGIGGLALLDLDEAGLAETDQGVRQRGAKALRMTVDVTDFDQLQKAFADVERDFGGYSIVFNNAGIMAGDPVFPDTAAEKIRAVISVNLLGVMYGTKIAIESMGRQGGGVIINTSSPASFGPMPNDPFYSSTKAAVVNFTQGCAHFAASHAVRVNAILPGVTETAILVKSGDGKEVADWLKPMLEVVNKLQPADIANAFVTMVEDDTMAGECLYVQNAAEAGGEPTLHRLRDSDEYHAFAGSRG